MAKDRLDDFDLAALGLARPAPTAAAADRSGSGSRDDVPEHFYQCAVILSPKQSNNYSPVHEQS